MKRMKRAREDESVRMRAEENGMEEEVEEEVEEGKETEVGVSWDGRSELPVKRAART